MALQLDEADTEITLKVKWEIWKEGYFALWTE